MSPAAVLHLSRLGVHLPLLAGESDLTQASEVFTVNVADNKTQAQRTLLHVGALHLAQSGEIKF